MRRALAAALAAIVAASLPGNGASDADVGRLQQAALASQSEWMVRALEANDEAAI